MILKCWSVCIHRHATAIADISHSDSSIKQMHASTWSRIRVLQKFMLFINALPSPNKYTTNINNKSIHHPPFPPFRVIWRQGISRRRRRPRRKEEHVVAVAIVADSPCRWYFTPALRQAAAHWPIADMTQRRPRELPLPMKSNKIASIITLHIYYYIASVRA